MCVDSVCGVCNNSLCLILCACASVSVCDSVCSCFSSCVCCAGLCVTVCVRQHSRVSNQDNDKVKVNLEQPMHFPVLTNISKNLRPPLPLLVTPRLSFSYLFSSSLIVSPTTATNLFINKVTHDDGNNQSPGPCSQPGGKRSSARLVLPHPALAPVHHQPQRQRLQPLRLGTAFRLLMMAPYFWCFFFSALMTACAALMSVGLMLSIDA